MSVTAIGNENRNYFAGTASKVEMQQNAFTLEETKDSVVEQPQKEPGKVPEAYAGFSFVDLMASGNGKTSQIPVVNNIVSAKNPEDGEIYLTYFTDEKITCTHADGKGAWELPIEGEEQKEIVKDFFKEFNSYDWAKELYSGEDIGMASSKSFWMELFTKENSIF